MSVSSEIQELKENLANAYDAAEAKGATMPEIESSENLATTVASIPSGGGDIVEATNTTGSNIAAEEKCWIEVLDTDPVTYNIIPSKSLSATSITAIAQEAIADNASGEVMTLLDGNGTYAPTLTSKIITSNGTYTISSSDNAYGFNSITATVPATGSTIEAVNVTGSTVNSGDKVWVEYDDSSADNITDYLTYSTQNTVTNTILDSFSDNFLLHSSTSYKGDVDWSNLTLSLDSSTSISSLQRAFYTKEGGFVFDNGSASKYYKNNNITSLGYTWYVLGGLVTNNRQNRYMTYYDCVDGVVNTSRYFITNDATGVSTENVFYLRSYNEWYWLSDRYGAINIRGVQNPTFDGSTYSTSSDTVVNTNGCTTQVGITSDDKYVLLCDGSYNRADADSNAATHLTILKRNSYKNFSPVTTDLPAAMSDWLQSQTTPRQFLYNPVSDVLVCVDLTTAKKLSVYRYLASTETWEEVTIGAESFISNEYPFIKNVSISAALDKILLQCSESASDTIKRVYAVKLAANGKWFMIPFSNTTVSSVTGYTKADVPAGNTGTVTIGNSVKVQSEKIIRQNGTYTADPEYDAIEQVDVGIGQTGDTYTDVPNLSGISYAQNDKVWLNYRPEVVAGNASTDTVPSYSNQCGIAAAFALDDTYLVIGCTGIVDRFTSIFKTYNTSTSGTLTVIDTANSYANYSACIGLYTDENGNLILNHGGTYRITNSGEFITKSNGQVFDETGVAKSLYSSKSVTLYYNNVSIGNGGTSGYMYNSAAIIVAKGDYMYYLDPQGQGGGYLVSYNITTGIRTNSSSISALDSTNVYVTNNRKYLYIGARGSNDDKLATLGDNNPSVNHTNLTNLLTNSIVVGQNHYGSLTNDWLSLCKTDGSAYEIYKYDSVNDVFVDKAADFSIDTSLLTNFAGYYGAFAISADGKKILVPWIDSGNSTHATLYWYSRAAGWVIQKYDAINSNSVTGYADEAIATGAAGDVIVGTKIEPTLTTLNVTSNGTYTPETGDGFDEVNVNVSQAIDNSTITENASNQLQTVALVNANGSGSTPLKVWQGTESQWTNGVGTNWYNWRTPAVEIQNFTIVGYPTITNKVAYGFSTSDYLTFPAFDTQAANTWEFGCKITAGLGGGSSQSIIYGSGFRFIIGQTIQGKMNLYLSSNGTSWDIASNLVGNTTLTTNYTYYCKILFDGLKYQLLLSTDGENFSPEISVDTTAKVYANNNPIYLGSSSVNGMNGQIDLANTYIKVDGNTIWTPYTEVSLQCYTLESTPTTASAVYSEPNTASALTITSVGTGTITLSDTNTYTYTQSGDQTTYQTIGEAHPTWLCNINGVGVKVGNTLIADNTDTSALQTTANLVTSVDASSTDTEYPSAKLFYDTCVTLQSELHTINSGS